VAETLGGAPFGSGLANCPKKCWLPLQQAVENYKERFGFYPEAVLADQIYRSRENRSYCKKHDIRLSGPPLGRPPRDDRPNKELEKQDMKERNEIEGGFGVGKRRYGLAQIMARLKETAESVIMLQFLVINLDRRLRSLFCHFLCIFMEGIFGQNADKNIPLYFSNPLKLHFAVIELSKSSL